MSFVTERNNDIYLSVYKRVSFDTFLVIEETFLSFHNTNSAFKERRLRENTELSEFVFLRIYNVLYITFTFNDEIRTVINNT